MENVRKNHIFILCVLIFLYISGILSADVVSWKKYSFEEASVEARCFPEEARLVADDVHSQLSCGKMCFLDDNCQSTFYHAENQRCVSCDVFMKGAPLTSLAGSVHYTDRDYKIDCKDILDGNKFAESGVYEIRLRNSETIQVYCDMTTDGGGWTVFQKRFDGSVYFGRTFSSYENGFGDMLSEFWLGLKYVQELADLPTELWVDASFTNGGSVHEKYGRFELIGTNYKLSVDTQPLEKSGSTSQHYFAMQNGSPFSATGIYTDDCNGWWGNSLDCFPLNLNKDYRIASPYYDMAMGMLDKSKMMIRRK